MSNHNSPEIIEIHELDPEIIPPLTSRMNDPDYSGGAKIVVIGKPGCFAPGTQIMMFDGAFKSVEDVQVGDQVMGDDSTPRNVLELCHDVEIMYSIIPIVGESYTVNAKHKLVIVDTCTFSDYKNNIETIVEISVEDFLKKPEKEQKQWLILNTSVDFPEKHVEMDPYVFGLQLGDKNSIEVSIPSQYKINSRRHRVALLSGICESMCSIHTSSSIKHDINFLHGIYTINHASKTLIDDITFLANSLGYLTNTSVSNTYKYFVTIYVDIDMLETIHDDGVYVSQDNLFLHQRSIHKISGKLAGRRFTIQSKGEGQYYGFTLDGNHRFLLSSCDIVRNTGKSSLIKALLYAKKHMFPVGMAMSGTEDTNHDYVKFIPSVFVYNDYDEDKIKDFVKRQKLAIPHLPNPWAFLIIDDCTDDPKIFNKPLQNALFKKGRHLKFFYILSLQVAMDAKHNIRTNIDGTFILREPLENNREKLYRNFASIIPTYRMFCDIMDQVTEDFHAIYIHNATKSNNWKECVFYWRPPLPPSSWKAGCPEYWEFNYDRYNESYVDPVEF